MPRRSILPGPIETAIRDALGKLRFGRERFRRLDARREHKVLQDVKRRFLTDFQAVVWWDCLRYESLTVPLFPAYSYLPQVCPTQGKKVWLVPCQEDLVYESDPASISQLLAECALFEYAVVDKKLSWLVGESCDKGLLAVGTLAIECLRALALGP